MRTTFDYALIRVVPRPERGELINAGVILYCRARDFLQARQKYAGTLGERIAPVLHRCGACVSVSFCRQLPETADKCLKNGGRCRD